MKTRQRNITVQKNPKREQYIQDFQQNKCGRIQPTKNLTHTNWGKSAKLCPKEVLPKQTEATSSPACLLDCKSFLNYQREATSQKPQQQQQNPSSTSLKTKTNKQINKPTSGGQLTTEICFKEKTQFFLTKLHQKKLLLVWFMESKNPAFQLLHFLLQVSKSDHNVVVVVVVVFVFFFSCFPCNDKTNPVFSFCLFFAKFCDVAKSGTIKKTKGKINSNLAIP
jgi:hypothetical protein